MAKACPKCKEVECEECPEWIFTLADLIMCMMGLFVLLWVMKPGGSGGSSEGAGAAAAAAEPTQRQVEVIAAIREAFGYEPSPDSQDPIDLHILLNRTEGVVMPKGRGDGGETRLERPNPKGRDSETTTIRPGPQASVGSSMVFEKASAEVPPANNGLLDELANQIRGHRNIVYVKGHTSLDDFGPDTDEYLKMQLSLKRAQAVADALVSRGVSPEVIRIQGCSTFEPIVQRRFEPNVQSKNRRVEVEVTSTLADEIRQR
jgi:outer membrane protein OmpA-like peptidoglycan-associated protein